MGTWERPWKLAWICQRIRRRWKLWNPFDSCCKSLLEPILLIFVFFFYWRNQQMGWFHTCVTWDYSYHYHYNLWVPMYAPSVDTGKSKGFEQRISWYKKLHFHRTCQFSSPLRATVDVCTTYLDVFLFCQLYYLHHFKTSMFSFLFFSLFEEISE